MKRTSAPTMIEDGRLSGNEPAARWFDETARHQFLRECELEGLITERTRWIGKSSMVKVVGWVLVVVGGGGALLLSVRLRPRDNSQLLNPIIS